jgi:hypothetical protein
MSDTSPFIDAWAGDPRNIPGIYNYCDRWCERCRYASRCLSFRASKAAERGDPPPPPPPDDGISRPWLEDANRDPTPDEMKGIEAAIKRQHARLDADPLKARAREYTALAYPVLSALGPILRDRQDEIVIAALEVLEHHVFLIAAKTVRALHGYHDDDYDRGDRQCDAHGSAKVARLAIKESRDAWDVLTQVGRAAADGVPQKMIETLTALDAAIADRFPMAMSFVRAGFDTDEAV